MSKLNPLMSPSGVSRSGLRSKRRLPLRHYGSLKASLSAELKTVGVQWTDTHGLGSLARFGGRVGVSAIYRISAPESLSNSVSCLETLSPISFYLVSGYSSTSLLDSVVPSSNKYR